MPGLDCVYLFWLECHEQRVFFQNEMVGPCFVTYDVRNLDEHHFQIIRVFNSNMLLYFWASVELWGTHWDQDFSYGADLCKIASLISDAALAYILFMTLS
jgi:hypothetical protein